MYVLPLSLIGGTVLILLWRNRPSGFFGTFYFAILAPTFVVPIMTEMAAERRMYLALAAPIVFIVVGGYRLAEYALRRRRATLKPNRSYRPPS